MAAQDAAPTAVAQKTEERVEAVAPEAAAEVAAMDVEQAEAAPETPVKAEAEAAPASLVVPMAALVPPTKPKKATSAYWLYSLDARGDVTQEMQKKSEKVSLGQVAKQIGKQWAELSAAERKVYEDKAAADKQRYEKEMEAYNCACDPPAALRRKFVDLIPKKPPTAAVLFKQEAEQREKAVELLKAAGQDAKETQVTAKLNEMWKEASDETKNAFKQRELQQQMEYLKEQKVWQATPEFKELDAAEKAHAEVQKAVAQAKAAEEARLLAAEKAAKKRSAQKSADATPPAKKAKGAESTPLSDAKKPAKAKEPAKPSIDDKVLKDAQKLGMEAAMMNLFGRPEVVSSGKSAAEVLKALQKSGGLVNPAKRSLLGC